MEHHLLQPYQHLGQVYLPCSSRVSSRHHGMKQLSVPMIPKFASPGCGRSYLAGAADHVCLLPYH